MVERDPLLLAVAGDRSCSEESGLIATCVAPLAAKTTVLAPDPVSSVCMPAFTFCSSQSSAAQAIPEVPARVRLHRLGPQLLGEGLGHGARG